MAFHYEQQKKTQSRLTLKARQHTYTQKGQVGTNEKIKFFLYFSRLI
jgi:hypothetical protein